MNTIPHRLDQLRPRSILAALLICAAPSFCLAATPMPPGYSIQAIQASVSGNKLTAMVEASAPMPCPTLAAVFTDFEAMPSFIPGLESSVVASRGEGWAIIRQRGTLRYGIFSQSFSSERKVTMALPSRIDSASTGRPDEPRMSSSTTFAPGAAGFGCRARYSTHVELPAWAPTAIAASAAKANASAQMSAMLREAHRRHPSLGPKPLAPAGAPERPSLALSPLPAASAAEPVEQASTQAPAPTPAVEAAPPAPAPSTAPALPPVAPPATEAPAAPPAPASEQPEIPAPTGSDMDRPL